MRYQDCPTVEVDIGICGTVAAVWELISDIALPSRFSSEVQGVEWLGSATGPAVGARFIGTNQHKAIGDWQAECTITAMTPGQGFEWTVGDVDHPSAIWRFTISEAGEELILRQWFQMGPGRSGLNYAIDAMPDKEERIVAKRLREHEDNMRANLIGIKALVEGPTS